MSLTLTDAAGNIGAAVISTKDKDTVLPEVTVNPAVTITSSNHVLYSVDGTCSEEGQTVTVTIDTVNALSYCTGGVFTISDIDLTFVPDSVSLLITINHMDAAGNLANQATTTVLKDTTISQPSMPDLAAADDTGLSNSDNITKNTTLLTFSGTADAGDSVQIYKNGFPTGAPIIATGGTYTIDLSLTAGATYSITAKATDSVGNISSVSDVASITIDTIAPAAPSIPDLDPTDDSGAYSTDNITNIYSGATFNGSAENGSSVQLYRSSVALGSPGTATGGVYSISVNLSNGTNSMTAKATDLAGNVSAASSYIYITVDYTAPGLPSVDLNAAYDTGTSSTDNITRITAVGSTFYFNGSCENNGRVQLYKGGVAYGSLTSPSGTAWSVTVNSADFPDGAYSIQARTTDLAGNTGNISSALSVTFDTVAPAEPISLDLSTASDLGISNADNITSTTAPVITGYGTSGTNIQVYANSVANGATVASTSSWTKTMSLSAGSYTITAKALDVAGNASVDSASIDITIDTGKPTVTAAETMDVDSNGKIDHYKLTLSRDMLDSSFPGYVLNGGNVTTEWKISSRNNVKMRHGSSAPELDTINDNIIYLGFDEFTAPDTGVKPDITTTTAPAFFDYLAGNIIAQQNTITITEADRAKPVITEALSSADTYAKVTFSEIVSAATAEIPSNYLITGLIVNSASMFDSVGLDDNEVVLTTTAQTISTAYDLSVSNIQDLANIVTSAPGNTANFTCTGIHPAPQNVKALNGDTQNTISWEAVPGATGYNVYWSNTAGVTKATGTLISVGNVISYTHTGLTNGTRYYYVVTALGSYSESAESAEVNAVPSKYRQIEAGYNHTVVIKTDGTLWVWGLNSNGQLGDGTITSKSTPTQIGTDTNWASVSSGVSHTLATKTDGTLWAWGYNGYGQLGDGTTIQRLTPTQIGTDTNWASVSSGNSHSMAIKSDGTLWAWGYNGYGQLGDGTTIQKNIPVQIGVDTTWVSISVGGDYTVGIKTDGILWSWGKNNLCQLGDGTSVDKTTPTQIGVNTWASISTGFDYIMGIKTDGTLWGWGYNGYGQLGDGTITSKCTPVQIATDTWTSVAAGGSYAHTVAIKTDGTLWAWGSNYYYQLGDGTASQQNTPVQIGVDTTWVSVAVGSGYTLASKNETLWSWGYNLYGQLGKGTLAPYEPGQIVGATNWSKVSVGYRHTMGLQNDGTLWAWGDNSTAQLGDGTTLYQYNPMKIGMANWLLIDTRAFSSFGIQTDGILWAWGNNAGYQLGTGDSVDRISPTQIGVAAWLSVSAGISHSLGIQSDGTLWAWGDNGSGQLGDGTLVGKSMPTQIGVATWALVSAGSAHTLGIKSDGTLWAWGDNGSGQLGDGTTVSKSFPVQIGTATWASVSASNAHTIGIQTNGRLYAWGNNAYGQLGDGTTVNKSTPTLIGTATWASVSTDWGYTMGIKTDGTLWAWGRNSSGQLGDGTTVQRISPVQIGTATWASISTCPNIFAFTVGTQTDGTLWAWGDNSYGQLGYGRIPEPVLPF
jgi:alpha-tubulin suppressor-like RCC1 family protein